MNQTRCTVISNSVVAKHGRGAPALMGVSSPDLPVASSGAAGLSFEDEVSALEARGFAPAFVGIDTGSGDDICAECAFGRDGRLVSIKYASTFRVAAASETISNSTSSVGA